MVEISVINAGKLAKSWEEPESPEGIAYREWKNASRHHHPAGFEDISHKLSTTFTLVSGDNMRLNHVVLMYRRKNLNYVERIDLRSDDFTVRYAKMKARWVKIQKWVLYGEISHDSDIVIYRTLKSFRRDARLPRSIRDKTKYPIRLVDDTYAIITGSVHWYQQVNDKLHGEMCDTVRFDEFMDGCVYDYNPDADPATSPAGLSENPTFRNRCWYLWVWLRSHKWHLEALIDLDNYLLRGELVLWKNGKCLLKSPHYVNCTPPVDILDTLEPENLAREVKDIRHYDELCWYKEGSEGNF